MLLQYARGQCCMKKRNPLSTKKKLVAEKIKAIKKVAGASPNIDREMVELRKYINSLNLCIFYKLL